MKNTITRVEAMNYAIESVQYAIKEFGAYAECDEELVKVLTKIRDQIAKPHTTSPEAKSKANEKRKAATAAARAALMEQVLPVLQRGQLPPPREHPLPVQQRLPGGPSLPLSRQPALPPWGRPAFSWPVSLQQAFSRLASFP